MLEWVSMLRRLARFAPFAPFALFAALIATTTACVTKPTMHLNHAEISGVQLATMPPGLGVVMTVVVDVTNPNSYDVAVRAFRGQAIMADRVSLPVEFRAPNEGVWMPAGRTTPLRVPVSFPLDLAMFLLRESFASPAIPYRFVGTADVTATTTFRFEKDNYAVDERGFITREQIAAILPNSLFPPPQ